MSVLNKSSVYIVERKEEIEGIFSEVKADGTQFGEWRQQALETLEMALKRPNTFVVVAKDSEDRVQGISTGYLDRQEAVVWWTILSQKSRGTGLSRRMTAFRDSFFTSRGADTVSTIAATEAGRSLLVRQGFYTKDGSHYSRWIAG